jgi:hypothetical protein
MAFSIKYETPMIQKNVLVADMPPGVFVGRIGSYENRLFAVVETASPRFPNDPSPKMVYALDCVRPFSNLMRWDGSAVFDEHTQVDIEITVRSRR